MQNCLYCQIELIPNKTGRPKKYCQDKCRISFDNNKAKEVRAKRKSQVCLFCKKGFEIGFLDNKQKYCSNHCRKLANKPAPIQVITCLFCDSIFTRPAIRGNRPSGCMTCRTSGPARRYDGYRRYTNFVISRDNQICQICLVAVDLNADKQTKWAPTLDHIIPKSRNGSHEPENLRLAHRWCNSIRQNKD